MRIKIHNDKVTNAETGELIEGIEAAVIHITAHKTTAVIKLAEFDADLTDIETVNVVYDEHNTFKIA